MFIQEVRIGQTAPLEQKNLAPSFFRGVYLRSFLEPLAFPGSLPNDEPRHAVYESFD